MKVWAVTAEPHLVAFKHLHNRCAQVLCLLAAVTVLSGEFYYISIKLNLKQKLKNVFFVSLLLL